MIFCHAVYGYLEEAASRKRQWRVGKPKWASQATGDKHALHVYALTIGYKGNVHKDFKYLFCKIPSKKRHYTKVLLKEVWFECNVVGFFSTDSKVGMTNHPTITQFRNKRGQNTVKLLVADSPSVVSSNHPLNDTDLNVVFVFHGFWITPTPKPPKTFCCVCGISSFFTTVLSCSECFVCRRSKSFNIPVEWHAVTIYWLMRQSVRWVTWQLRLKSRSCSMYSLWQRSLSTLVFCDFPSNKNAVIFVEDLRQTAVFLTYNRQRLPVTPLYNPSDLIDFVVLPSQRFRDFRASNRRHVASEVYSLY